MIRLMCNIFLYIPITDQQWPYLAIGNDLPGRGRGVFVLIAFQAGEIICDYNGQIHGNLTQRATEEYLEQQETTLCTMVVIQISNK